MAKDNHTSTLPAVSFEVDSIVEGANRHYGKTQSLQQPQSVIFGGHFIDERLKYNQNNYTSKDVNQNNDSLESMSLPFFCDGIHLPSGPDFLVNTLMRLLTERASNPNEYLGNYPPTLTEVYGKPETAPRYVTKIFDLAVANSGKSKPSGTDIREVVKSLKYLAEKNHCLTWTEKGKDGRQYLRWEPFQKVITHIGGAALSEDISAEEAQRIKISGAPSLDTLLKSSVVITLNPLLVLDRGSKFVPTTSDYPARLRAATGSTDPSEAVRRLALYFYRACSGKAVRESGLTCIRKSVLLKTLLLDLRYKGRRKVQEERLENAINSCMHEQLPLVLSYKITKSKKYNEDMFEFVLNVDFMSSRSSKLPAIIPEEAA